MLISNTIRGLQRGMRRSVIAAWSRSAAFTSVEKQLGYSEFSSELPQVSVTAKDWRKGATESIIVIPFFEPVTESKAVALKALVPDSIPSDIKGLIDGVLNEGAFTGQAGSEIVLHLPSAVSSESTWQSKYIVMVGLGGSDGSSAKSCKALGKQLAALSWRHSGSSVGILPVGMELDVPQVLHGMFDASYHDMRFRKADASNGPKTAVQQNITIFTEREERTENYDHAYFIASGVKFAKDLVGAPANAKTPTAMASIAKELANQHGLECTVLGEAECVARGMGGYLAVQQGSKFPPQFIHMVYKPQHSSGETKKVVLIGKGLTFDSGGYNLKVGAGSAIETMKIDMGGLAAVLGCAKAIAQLKPANVEVHFVSAVCENMVSANAVRPGDVVTASNGKTIEVVNTDAEGRLTLADALVYAQTLGDVHSVIDLATLTGACIVGLGDKVAGLYSSDKQLLDELKDAAARSDEKVWHLPLEDSYRERIKSPIANIRNVGGGGGGGSITAALFLQEFVEKGTAWAHIDIAGPVWDDKLNKPTGYGVKMLVDYLMNVGAK